MDLMRSEDMIGKFRDLPVVENDEVIAFVIAASVEGVECHLKVGSHSHIHWTDKSHKTRELLVSVRFDELGRQWTYHGQGTINLLTNTIYAISDVVTPLSRVVHKRICATLLPSCYGYAAGSTCYCRTSRPIEIRKRSVTRSPSMCRTVEHDVVVPTANPTSLPLGGQYESNLVNILKIKVLDM
ncbi:hypothetical protein L1887_31302 [Cichorium endivia]|nr:hypothetical protein L1887_31302 [Cichorium endivia]